MIVTFIAFIIAVLSCIPAYADTVFDNAEELYENKELILETANKMLPPQIKTKISSDDIDFGKALRVYVDTDILNDSEMTVEKIHSYAENSDYIYYLPVYLENMSVFLTISKGLGVTERARGILDEESIQRLEDLEGKWYVPQVEVFRGQIDYLSLMNVVIDNNNLDVSEVLFFGGISGNMPLVAACINNSNVIFRIIDKNQMNLQLGSPEGNSIDYNDLYSFNQIKAIAEGNKVEEGEFGSGIGTAIMDEGINNNVIILITLSVLVIVVLTVSMIIIKKRKGIKAYEH